MHELSVAEAGRRLRAGTLTSSALTGYALNRIAALDPGLSAFIRVTAERALADAARADRDFARGRDSGPLQGIPYALKDNIDSAGVATTCNSRLMADADVAADADAAVEARLRAAGAVLLGKLALHEFATSWPGLESPFPPARNPWDRDRIPGGSSSGCGVAVAAGFARLTVGTDTGGSIRWPASCCGVVGLKPTRGRVPCRGIFPLAPTLDSCGLIAWSVEDAALGFETIADPEPATPGADGDERGVGGLRLAYPRHHFAAAAPALAARIDEAAERFARLGATVEEVRLPEFALFDSCGRVIMLAESFGVHAADLRARPLAYSRNAYRRLVPGALIGAADYLLALRVARHLEETMETGVFATHDAILTATVLTPPPPLAEYAGDDPPATATQTITANVIGNPALTLPAGFVDGLPVGAQLIGRKFGEATLFRLGRAFEAGEERPRPPL